MTHGIPQSLFDYSDVGQAGARRSAGRARFTMSQSQPQRSYPKDHDHGSDSYVGPNGMKQAGDHAANRSKATPIVVASRVPAIVPTARIDLWKVSLDEPSKSNMEEGSQAFCLPTRSRAPSDFTSKRTAFTLPVVAPRFAACLRSTWRSPPPKSVSSTQPPQASLAATQNPSALQFNVSHSAGMALIAIAVNIAWELTSKKSAKMST